MANLAIAFGRVHFGILTFLNRPIFLSSAFIIASIEKSPFCVFIIFGLFNALPSKKSWIYILSCLASIITEALLFESNAIASNLDMPIAGIFSDNDKPLAADTPTRTPVKFPGPMQTPIASKFLQLMSAKVKIFSHNGNSLSACPFTIGSMRSSKHSPFINKETAQCAADVSNANTY